MDVTQDHCSGEVLFAFMQMGFCKANSNTIGPLTLRLEGRSFFSR